MLHRRAVIGLIASAGTLSGSQIVLAKEKHHNNGNALLGAKIKQNGKHSWFLPEAIGLHQPDRAPSLGVFPDCVVTLISQKLGRNKARARG